MYIELSNRWRLRLREDTFWKKVKLWIRRGKISIYVWRSHFGLLPTTWNIRGGRAGFVTCELCSAHRNGSCQGSFGVDEVNSILECMAQKTRELKG